MRFPQILYFDMTCTFCNADKNLKKDMGKPRISLFPWQPMFCWVTILHINKYFKKWFVLFWKVCMNSLLHGMSIFWTCCWRRKGGGVIDPRRYQESMTVYNARKILKSLKVISYFNEFYYLFKYIICTSM